MLHTQILLQTKVTPQTGSRNTVFPQGLNRIFNTFCEDAEITYEHSFYSVRCKNHKVWARCSSQLCSSLLLFTHNSSVLSSCQDNDVSRENSGICKKLKIQMVCLEQVFQHATQKRGQRPFFTRKLWRPSYQGSEADT